MDPETHYRLLKLLESDPNLTQRQMASEMGLSLGKFNYCLKELVKKGSVKVERFTSSDNKAGYIVSSYTSWNRRKISNNGELPETKDERI